MLLENYDSNHENHILDTSAFCQGVDDAREEAQLVYMVAGDPMWMSACEQYAYTRFGVLLRGRILNSSDSSYVSGFNSAMAPRLMDALGDDYAELGKVDKAWYAIDDTFLFDLASSIEATPLGRDSVRLQLSRSFRNLTDSSLEGVTVSYPSKNSKAYSFRALYEGIVVPSSNKNDRTFLKIDISQYKGSKGYCGNKNHALSYMIPVMYD